MCVPLKVQEQDLIRPWKEDDCEVSFKGLFSSCCMDGNYVICVTHKENDIFYYIENLNNFDRNNACKIREN